VLGTTYGARGRVASTSHCKGGEEVLFLGKIEKKSRGVTATYKDRGDETGGPAITLSVLIKSHPKAKGEEERTTMHDSSLAYLTSTGPSMV